MVGDLITLGIGTPSSISTLTLFGLSVNPEVRDAEVIVMLGLYDPTEYLWGYIDHTLPLTGSYNPTVRLTGDT